MTMFPHQLLARKTSSKKYDKRSRSVQPQCRSWEDRSRSNSTKHKGNITSAKGWLCRLECSSADGISSSNFVLSWQTKESNCQSMAETQSFIDESVVEWRRRLECASLFVSLLSFARWRYFIFQSWFNNCHNVHNEVTLICATAIWCWSDLYF